MKHAGSAALDRLEPILVELRDVPALREKTRGVFYRKSKAFLHFHEDPSGLYADIRLQSAFDRYPVTSPVQQEALLRMVREICK